MQLVIPPLHLGHQGDDVQNLQDIFMFFISNGILIPDDEELFDKLESERQKKFFGTGTAALVKQFRLDATIETPSGTNPLVDEETATAINVALNAGCGTTQRIVTGRIVNKNNKPLKDVPVILYDKDYKTDQRLGYGEITTDGDGYYSIPYSLDEFNLYERKTADLYIQVTLPDETTVESKVYYNVSYNQIINLTIEEYEATFEFTSEYQELYSKILPLLEHESDVALLTQENVDFFANELNENPVTIRLFILAQIFSGTSSDEVSAEIFYGLLRQNLPDHFERLICSSEAVLRNALLLSMSLSIIQHFDTGAINGIITALLQTPAAYILGTDSSDFEVKDKRTVEILSIGLDTSGQMGIFLNYYFLHKADANFWTSIISGTSGSITSDDVEHIQSLITNSILTGNNTALVRRLTKPDTEFLNPKTHVARSQDDWEDLIGEINGSADFIYPDYVSSEGEGRMINYAKMLKANYDKAFPMETLMAEIGAEMDAIDPPLPAPFSFFRDNIDEFLSHDENLTFDIKVTPAIALRREGNSFNFEGWTEENRQGFINNIAIIQRLGNLTMNYAAIREMKIAGITSAKEISSMSRDSFVESFATILGSENAAKSVYDNATSITTISMALVGELNAEMRNYMPVLYSKELVTSLTPDLETLFGSLDYCVCTNCRSIYSPSAYLVDTLELLRKYNTEAYSRLNQRRADIWEIKLSCQNANTPMPYIDLVNEILEDLLHPDFQTNQYTISARNTTLKEEQLKAYPEHLKTEYPTTSVGPYKNVLMNAVYPWDLPFNYYKEQIDEFLKIPEATAYDIGKAFNALTPHELLEDTDSVCRYLGITQREFDILTGTIFDISVPGNSAIPVALRDYWGIYHDENSGSPIDLTISDPLAPGLLAMVTPLATANLETKFNLVNIFLQQSKLTFGELLELLDCYFINPVTSTPPATIVRKLKIKNITGAPDGTCNINELWIEGLEEEDMDRIHRFVRLKNKLGWTFYELDRAIRVAKLIDVSIASINEDLILILGQMRMLTFRLNCSLDELLVFWDTIQFNKYSDFSGESPEVISTQYMQLFRNRAVVDIEDENYPFPIDDENNVTDFPIRSTFSGDELDSVNLDIVLSSLSIAKNDFSYLISYFKNSTSLNGIFTFYSSTNNLEFTYENLSALCREVTLARLLKISIKDWCFYRDWIKSASLDISPFISPLETCQFLDYIKTIRNSGLSRTQINYLFNGTYENEEMQEKTDELLLAQIGKMRAKLFSLSTYDAELDTDGETLIKRLEYVVSNSDAQKIVGLLKRLPITTSSYTFDVDNLTAFNTFVDSTTFNPFVSAAEAKLIILGIDATSPTFTHDTITKLLLHERLQYFFDLAIKPILKASVKSIVSNSFKLNEATVNTLFEILINNGTDSAYVICLNDNFVNNPSLPTVITDVFKVLEKVNKISTLINTYDLNEEDVYLLSNSRVDLSINIDIANLPVSISATEDWLKLIDWIHLRGIFGSSKIPLFNILAPTLNGMTDIKERWVNHIKYAFGVSEEDIEVLVGDKTVNSVTASATTNILDFDFADPVLPQLQTSSYWKLLDCLGTQSQLETSMEICNGIANAIKEPGLLATLQMDADLVINLMKSKCTNGEWLTTLKPINDRLRIKRRDTMLSYLLGNPCDGYKGVWRTSNDFFEQFLIDTDMMPCMMTSRTRQAISSVQLFVERCLLGVEEYAGNRIFLTPETARQWNLWRKYYRIWEANRKVFIYPENWIEPDLRDSKSPFFVEFEKFLKQNEITKENVEIGYKMYLERLDEVSHLDPVGIHTDEATGVVHAWGRTRSHPHIYYHRMKAENEWTPWVKMNVQIDGDHFVPVMWRGRARLYWLVFSEQMVEKPSKLSLDEEMSPPEKYWKIELAWSEFKNNLWQPKQLGKENLESMKFLIWNYGAIKWNYDHMNDPGYDKSWHTFVPLNTPDTIKRCMNFLKDNITFYCRKELNELEFIITENVKCLTPEMVYSSISPSTPALSVGYDWIGKTNDFFDQNANSNNPHFLKNHIGKFCVKYNGVFAEKLAYQQYFNYYHEYLSGVANNIGYFNFLSGYEYRKDPLLGYTHDPDENYWKLLDTSPGYDPRKEKYIILQKQIPFEQSNQQDKINFHKFFYRDYRNSFYVERTKDPVKYPAFSLGTSYAGYTIGLNSGIIPADNTIFSSGPGSAVPQLSSDPGLLTSYPNQQYRFYPFYHYNVNAMSQQLFEKGLDGLFDFNFVNAQSNSSDFISFNSEYDPTIYVDSHYPTSNIDYSVDGPYSLYNWELFFHIPMLVANRLMQNQNFFEARQWFHYVFDPTSLRNGGTERFWNFLPFNAHAIAGIPTITQIMTGTLSPDTQKAISKWAQDPFKPHLVARTRLGAYMRNAVMKYLDNLIAWGDQLFRRDTLETVSEATLMYILAAQILGRRPYRIPARRISASQTYTELMTAGLNAFSNAQVAVESILASTGVTLPVSNVNMDYFCIPPNDKLLSYWDVVADRLFKIRHCQNIDGVERSLALYDPPIDPALLVKAASMGVPATDADNEVLSPLPQYRFSVMVQKASELAQEVKSMGSALLAAIEKQDAEWLSLLRSSHEIQMLEAVKELKQMQLEEASLQIESLVEQRKMIQFRKDYYNSLVENGLNAHEELQLDSLKLSIPLKYSQGAIGAMASVLHAIPNVKAGVPTSMGVTFGGANLGSLTEAISASIGIAATINDIIGSMAGIKGANARRKDEWVLQNKLAERELNQIEKQILASEIRKAISKKELSNHELQMKHTAEMDELMHSKFTNEELYDWMIGEIAVTYFQSYNLAVDVAKRAERCYNYELGTITPSDFISFGYWDSLKKGLLAGDNLLHDIKRMDIAYLEQNRRQHELIKHVSLASFDNNALMEFRKNKTVKIEFPEWLFDLDYPGHYFRRIKSISISIPCIAGPYTSVSCKLTLNSSKYRKSPIISTSYVDENNYKKIFSGGQSIATSNAQNDSGMFDFNFRDERYLPFEGAGVISEWKLEIPAKYVQFDINSISDVIFHIKYTARYDSSLAGEANDYVDKIVDATLTGAQKFLPRLFSLKNEFANEWNKYLNDVADEVDDPTLDITLTEEIFPYFCKGKTITLLKAIGQLVPVDDWTGTLTKVLTSDSFEQTPTGTGTPPPETLSLLANGTVDTAGFLESGVEVVSGPGTTISLVFDNTTNLDKIRDIHFAVIYKLT